MKQTRKRHRKTMRKKQGGMMRTLRSRVQSTVRPETRVYNAVKDYFTAGQHSRVTLEELANITRDAPEYASSTGKTYFDYISLDTIFSAEARDDPRNLYCRDFIYQHHLLLQNLYPYYTVLRNRNLRYQNNHYEAHLAFVLFNVEHTVTPQDAIELLNRLEIELNTYNHRICFIRFRDNNNNNTQSRWELDMGYGTRIHDRILEYLYVSVEGRRPDKLRAINYVIDNIRMSADRELDERLKQELLRNFRSIDIVESSAEQNMQNDDDDDDDVELIPATTLVRRPSAATPSATLIQRPSAATKPIEEPDECVICAEDLRNNHNHPNVIITSCNHYFHKDCLSLWCEKKHNCPICRARLPNNCGFLRA